MGLYSLFKLIVLITNALAILNEKRFLPKSKTKKIFTLDLDDAIMFA